MAYDFFRSVSLSRFVDVPKSYARKVAWLPQIGDIVPNFSAVTTQGSLSFHAWAEGRWTLLFSHPCAFTPVCSTELAALAALAPDFAARDVNVLGLTVNDAETQLAWHDDLERIFGHRIDFPMIADEGGELTDLFGMRHGREHADWPVRKTFLIDPDLRIRFIQEYPLYVGRGTEELIRVLDASMLAHSCGLATGVDWMPGEDCLVPPDVDDETLDRLFGENWRKVRAYLRSVRAPGDAAG